MGRLGAVLGPLEGMLEPSGSQKAPKMEPERVCSRASEATRAENDETLIFNVSTKDVVDLFRSQGFFCVLNMGPKWVPNRIIDAEGVRKPLDRPLDGSWSGFESSWSALGASTRARVGSGRFRGRSAGAQGEVRQSPGPTTEIPRTNGP